MGVSLMSSSWITEKNALSAYSGLHLNRPWETWIITNQEPISKKILGRIVIIDILSTFSQVEYVLSSDRVTAYAKGFFPDPRGPYFYVALLLVVLNATETIAEIVKENNLKRSSSPDGVEASNPPAETPPTKMNRFLVVVSQTTPYLMIITNIAVTIIQIQRGDTSAWIKLALTGITLIDITSWKPKEYRWYLDTVLGCPFAAGAIYYSNNLSRINIIFNLALSNQTLQKMIEETFKEELSALNEWLEETRMELEQRLLELQEEINQSSSEDQDSVD